MNFEAKQSNPLAYCVSSYTALSMEFNLAAFVISRD